VYEENERKKTIITLITSKQKIRFREIIFKMKQKKKLKNGDARYYIVRRDTDFNVKMSTTP